LADGGTAEACEAEASGVETEQVGMSAQNLRLITHFEDTYSCSGLCKRNLFYWTKPISAGMPEQPCVTALWDDVRVLCTQLGAPAITAAVLLLLLFFLSFPLYCWDWEAALERSLREGSEGRAEGANEGAKAGEQQSK